MLETVRAYGLEQLAASGEEEATRDAHAAWYVTLAELAEPELAGPDQGIWVRRLEADMANIRSALDWLVARGVAAPALRIAGAIGWLLSTAPYLEEARARFDAILALPGVEQAPGALAKVLASAGDVADWQGDQTRARAHYERALAIYREIDDRWRMVGMLRGLGSSAIDRGELDLASALLEESLALAHEVGHDWEAAAATNLIGTAVSARGDLGSALERHEEAAGAWRQLGDTGHVITALASAAWVALLSGEWSRAASAYRDALTLATAGGDEWYVTWCVIGAGGLVARRNSRLAVELFAAGNESRERLGMPLRPHVAATIDDMIASVRSRIGEGEFATIWQTGRALPIDAAAIQAFGVFDAEKPDAPIPFGLTRRERDVLRLLTDGRTDKEIASTLFVARATASHHVAAILAKLGVDSRTAAAAVALRHELV
jgi:non-specific serine/threonine protein kinase